MIYYVDGIYINEMFHNGRYDPIWHGDESDDVAYHLICGSCHITNMARIWLNWKQKKGI